MIRAFLYASLRNRFLISMGIITLPFILLTASVSYYVKSHTYSIDQVVEETLHEKDPVMKLQFLAYEAVEPVSRYVIFSSPDENKRFSELSRKIKQQFALAHDLPFASDAERNYYQDAQSAWQQCAMLAQRLFPISNMSGNAEALKIYDQFYSQFGFMMNQLHRLHDVANKEIHEEIEAAKRVYFRTLYISIGLAFLAFGLIIGIGIFLSRTVLIPVRQLYSATQEIIGGNLHHQVQTLRKDELGSLIGNFNVMVASIRKAHAVLKKEAIQDSLTGLLNHQEFRNLLKKEVERSFRYHHPLSLLIIDLDLFKQINDTYGHPAGDAVLRTVSEIIPKYVRQMDIVGRYGGDEFVVLLPETDHLEALELADRIHKTVSDAFVLVKPNESIKIRLSIGLASYPKHASTLEELVEAADQALYEAKKSGRNRIRSSQRIIQ